MKKYSWLLSLLILIASCTGTEEVTPVEKIDDAGARLASGPSSNTYPTQTINFSDAQGTYSYQITPTVSWSGSTTTWTYAITGVNGSFNVRAISHISFAGFSACMKAASITTTSGEVKIGGKEGTETCSTNGLSGDDEVIKIDGVTGSSLTITFTYNQALAASANGGKLYVKTSTVCDGVSIPGPDCSNTLGFSGTITEDYCDGVTSTNRPLAGTTVTASQDGQDDRTTTTDANGNYSFDNLGGTWSVAAIGQEASVTLGVNGDVTGVNFTQESRPNGSCAEIKGSVERFDCTGTSSVHSMAGLPVTLSSFGNTTYSASTTSDTNGNYTFSNVPVGNYTIIFAGAEQSAAVSSTSGSQTINFSVDNRPNNSCAAISGYVELTQCLDQTTVVGGWAGLTVTATNGTTTLTTTTDANGNFSFANVSNGTYSVTANGESKSVSVANSEGSYSLSYAFDTRNGLCGGDEVTACSLSQGYWFAKPQAIWPNNQTVTLGGKVYSQAEGKAIWNSSNKGGLLNAKAAFTQATAIKLSGVDASASVWADVAIIDAYFASIPKISATSIPKNSTANAAAKAAAGRIGNWIDANHCNESK